MNKGDNDDNDDTGDKGDTGDNDDKSVKGVDTTEDVLKELSGAAIASFCTNLIATLEDKGVELEPVLESMFEVMTTVYPDIVPAFDRSIKAIAGRG